MAAALIFIGAALSVVSAYVSFREVSPFLDLATSDAGRFQAISSGSVNLPFAESSRQDVLKFCYELADTILARAQPTERRHRLLTSCRDYAAQIAAASPTLGLAPAVGAYFAAELGDASAFNANLLAGGVSAPNEQWLAELRVELIERNFSLAADPLRALEAQDLRILAQSARGVGSIAKRYVQHQDFRERVTAIVEQLALSDQTRFLRNVQNAARAQTGGAT